MSITLNSKTYAFSGFNQNQQSLYSERSGGVPSSFSFLTGRVNTGTGKSDSTVKWNLSVPVVATEDTECSCVGDPLRTYYVRIEITVPSGSSAAERADLLARIQGLVTAPEFEDSVDVLLQPSA